VEGRSREASSIPDRWPSTSVRRPAAIFPESEVDRTCRGHAYAEQLENPVPADLLFVTLHSKSAAGNAAENQAMDGDIVVDDVSGARARAV
jgi:hypothetical protein